MRLVRLTLIAALVIGCHDSTAPAVINGTYPLRTYRYEPLPGLVSESVYQVVQITKGSITLNGDLSFHSSYTFLRNDSGTYSTVVVDCSGYWTPTETSPQGGQLITLTQTAGQGCYDRGTAEWDHHNHLTISWTSLGDTQHVR